MIKLFLILIKPEYCHEIKRNYLAIHYHNL